MVSTPVSTEPAPRLLRGPLQCVGGPRPLCGPQGGPWLLKGDPPPDAAARPGGGRGACSARGAPASTLPGADTPGLRVSADFVRGPRESPESR